MGCGRQQGRGQQRQNPMMAISETPSHSPSKTHRTCNQRVHGLDARRFVNKTILFEGVGAGDYFLEEFFSFMIEKYPSLLILLSGDSVVVH